MTGTPPGIPQIYDDVENALKRAIFNNSRINENNWDIDLVPEKAKPDGWSANVSGWGIILGAFGEMLIKKNSFYSILRIHYKDVKGTIDDPVLTTINLFANRIIAERNKREARRNDQ